MDDFKELVSFGNKYLGKFDSIDECHHFGSGIYLDSSSGVSIDG